MTSRAPERAEPAPEPTPPATEPTDRPAEVLDDAGTVPRAVRRSSRPARAVAITVLVIEQPLTTALQVQAAAGPDGDPSVFRRAFAANVGEDIDTGMQWLVDAAELHGHEPVSDLLTSLLTALRGEGAADDIAMLALRRLPPG